jgi:MFS family permease
MVLVAGCLLVVAGLAGTAGVLYLTAPHPGGWELVGPLLAAGLGSGMVIAPNQDFVMAYVPRREAGTASGTLTTAQRIGSAIGIAVIGTVLFGTVSVPHGPVGTARAFTHSAQLAMRASVAFVIIALLLVIALPRQVPSRR